MGLRGPAPRPSNLTKLLGNPGKRAINDQEPHPDTSPPVCPTWLDDEAKAKWAMLAPELIRLGILTSVDGDALAAYCQAYAEFKLSTETLQAEGRTKATETGYLTPHPAVAQQRSAWTTMKMYSAMFGLDPSSRSRIKIKGTKDEKDPFDAFLEGGN